MLRNKKYLLIFITSCWGRKEGKRKVGKGKGRGKRREGYGRRREREGKARGKSSERQEGREKKVKLNQVRKWEGGEGNQVGGATLYTPGLICNAL